MFTEERLRRAVDAVVTRLGGSRSGPEGLLYDADAECCFSFITERALIVEGCTTLSEASTFLRAKVLADFEFNLTEDLEAQRQLLSRCCLNQD